MRKLVYIILLLFLISNQNVFSQKYRRLFGGPTAGVSWYNGDLNHYYQFYKVHPSVGGFLRYSLGDRIAFAGSLNIVGVSGDYNYEEKYYPNSQNINYSFKRNFVDGNASMELNFFSFDHPYNPATRFTPYLTFGIGTAFYERHKEDEGNRNVKPTFVLSLPFGAGVKWKINRWVHVGAEWSVKKLFADDLDLVGFNNGINPSDPFNHSSPSVLHNNDWYSIFGVSISFHLYTKGGKCFDGF